MAQLESDWRGTGSSTRYGGAHRELEIEVDSVWPIGATGAMHAWNCW